MPKLTTSFILIGVKGFFVRSLIVRPQSKTVSSWRGGGTPGQPQQEIYCKEYKQVMDETEKGGSRCNRSMRLILCKLKWHLHYLTDQQEDLLYFICLKVHSVYRASTHTVKSISSVEVNQQISQAVLTCCRVWDVRGRSFGSRWLQIGRSMNWTWLEFVNYYKPLGSGIYDDVMIQWHMPPTKKLPPPVALKEGLP